MEKRLKLSVGFSLIESLSYIKLNLFYIFATILFLYCFYVNNLEVIENNNFIKKIIKFVEITSTLYKSIFSVPGRMRRPFLV